MTELIKLKKDMVEQQATHIPMPVPTQANARTTSRGASIIATTSHEPSFMDMSPVHDDSITLEEGDPWLADASSTQ